MRTQCPTCRKDFKVNDALVGRAAKCKRCGCRFEVQPSVEHGGLSAAVAPVTGAKPTIPHKRETDDVDHRSSRHSRPCSDFSLSTNEPATGHKSFEIGKSLLAAGDYRGAAARFRFAAWAKPGDDQVREALLDALKLHYWWMRLLQRVGGYRPAVLKEEESWTPFIILGVFGAVVSGCIKLMRANPDADVILWILVALVFAVFPVVKLANIGATLLVWRGNDRTRIFRPWESCGHVASFVLALGALLCILAASITHDALFAVLCIVSCFLSRPFQVAFSTRAGTPRYFMLAYLMLIVTLAVATVWMVAMLPNRTDWDQKIPARTGQVFIAFLLSAIAARPIRWLVLEACGSDRTFVDRSTQAEIHGGLMLSDRKLRQFHPELYGLRSMLYRLFNIGSECSAHEIRQLVREHLMHGAINPAVVVSIQPLVIAAYAEDLDCVVMLDFDESLVEQHNLSRGRRLLSVNTFMHMSDRELGDDLTWGPNHTNMWGNACPFIAEFLSDDDETIRVKLRQIPEEAWQRTRELASDWQLRRSCRPRDGRPLLSHISRRQLDS